MIRPGALSLVALATLSTGCDDTRLPLGSPVDASSPSVVGAHPPDAGPHHAGHGPTVVFAVTKLFLGDTNRDGHPDHSAWKQFGYDIDNVVQDCSGNTCQSVEPHCKPNAGGSPAISLPNGDDGIDNSFGENIVPLLLALDGKIGAHVDSKLASGEFTLLFAIDGLGPDSAYDPLPARFYRGGDLGHAPLLDGTDAWPVARDVLSDPSDVSKSKFAFPSSWVADDIWVSGLGPLTLKVPIHQQPLVLPIVHGIVSMELSANRRIATRGVISGVVPIEAIAQETPRVAGGFDASLCDGNTIDSVVVQVRQAADMMLDGTHGVSSETCNGMSIGLGFEAVRAELGEPVADPPPADPCPMK